MVLLVPAKFPVAFASAAPAGGIRQIPTTPGSVPGAAALTTGFPPLTFIQPSVGGIPPDGRDVNGILNRLSLWDQWTQAGGPVLYDSSFATSIGGYPRGALVSSLSGHAWYENLVDGNVIDPNVNSANWRVAFSPWSAQAWQAFGSANAQSITLSPAATSLAQLTGIPIHFYSQGLSTGPVTLNVNALGDVTVGQSNNAALGAGALVLGGVYTVVYNGAGFLLISPSSVFTDINIAGVTVSGVNNFTFGANIALLGNGGTTPNKYIRATNGAFEIMSSAYTVAIARLTDSGNFTIPGTLAANNVNVGTNVSVSGNVNVTGTINSGGKISTSNAITAGANIDANTYLSAVTNVFAGGNIESTGGRLLAALGAFGSGNSNAATILADFSTSALNPGFIRFPSGLIIQWGTQVLGGNGNTLTSFPFAFPTACVSVLCCEGAAATATWGSSFPTLHAAGGYTRSQWGHWGLTWTGSSWITGNLTTAWLAIGI